MGATAKMPEQIPIDVDLSDRQIAMYESPARLLWIGAGTKTGKTFGNAVWIADGILRGEPTAWCGPWASRTTDAYNVIKAILEYAGPPPKGIGDVSFNDSTRTIKARNGGRLDPYTGDNPQAIFGSGYSRVVIDEASRQTRATLLAFQTTTAVTRGKIHLAFNLDHGASNWAVSGLLRVQAMTPAERQSSGEDFMLFPTLGEGFVDQEYIDQCQQSMTPQMFAALFHAVIPMSDVSLFRDLDRVFSAVPVHAPHREHSYVVGVDLARKQDWTVATVIDVQANCAVDTIRFHEVSWTIQYERIAELYRRWRCGKAMVDQSGLGDPVVEELVKKGMSVEGIVFTENNRHALLEDLVVACDSGNFTIVNDARFEPHRAEMASFEYQLKDNGKVRFGAPPNMHDDCVFSLALAVRGTKVSNFGTPRFARADTSRIQVRDLAGF